MNSFNALQIEKTDSLVVRGFVQVGECRLDFRNATKCVVCLFVVEAGEA